MHWNLYRASPLHRVRARYWKLTPDEMEQFAYDEKKLVNWDIKLVRKPEEDAIFIGIFLYRYGIPLDYESVKGLAYYYNHIERSELPGITKFLKGQFGGSVREKGERIFLEGSREIYAAAEIASLARDAEARLKAKATITLEFAQVTEGELKEAGMPEAKLLPIPGTTR